MVDERILPGLRENVKCYLVNPGIHLPHTSVGGAAVALGNVLALAANHVVALGDHDGLMGVEGAQVLDGRRGLDGQEHLVEVHSRGAGSLVGLDSLGQHDVVVTGLAVSHGDATVGRLDQLHPSWDAVHADDDEVTLGGHLLKGLHSVVSCVVNGFVVVVYLLFSSTV